MSRKNSPFICILIISLSLICKDPQRAEAATAPAPVIEYFGGYDRYETAVKISRHGWPGLSACVILSGGDDKNLVDVLAAAPLAKMKDAPILLTESGQTRLNSFVLEELERLKVETVYVVSGKAVIRPEVLRQLNGMGIKLVELGGADQFDTAVNIAKQMGPVKGVVVTTGWGCADAASAASIAATSGMPIVLTETDNLPVNVKNYIDGMTALTTTHVIGGTAVISSAVMDELKNPVRIAGYDQYETNIKVLEYFADQISYGKTYIASGESSLVDALVGSSLAALTDSPILLVGRDMKELTINYAQNYLSPNWSVLGGEGAVPSALLKGLTAARLVEGNETSLENVSISGGLLIDAGSQGSVNLKNVKADRLVILSGAVNVQGCSIGNLIIDKNGDHQTLSLDGEYNKVVLNHFVELILKENSIVRHLIANSQSKLTVEPNAKISRLDSDGNLLFLGGTGKDSLEVGGDRDLMQSIESLVLVAEGEVLIQNGTIYQPYRFEPGVLNSPVKGIKVREPGKGSYREITADWDEGLLFDVQNPSGFYEYIIELDNGQTYGASLNWQVNDLATSAVKNPDRLLIYEILSFVPNEKDLLYSIKEWYNPVKAQLNSSGYIQLTREIAVSKIYLRHNGIWYKTKYEITYTDLR